MQPIKKAFIIDSLYCPDDVKDEISDLWEFNDFGNDFFYLIWFWERFDPDELSMSEKYPRLAEFLKENGINENTTETILIHYYW